MAGAAKKAAARLDTLAMHLTGSSSPQSRVPTVTLGSSCADIPLRGVGTAVFEDLGANQKNFSSKYADGIISAAVASNVRPLLIDCAHMYYNESEIGAALSRAIAHGQLLREELFVCTKIAHFNVGSHQSCSYVTDSAKDAYKGALADVQACSQRLNGHLDLCLLHWPGDPNTGSTDAAKAQGKRADVWRALETAFTNDLVAAIGVSNFTIEHFKQLKKTAKVTPAVNQIEVHPYLQQTELVAFCQQHNIHVMAYCPLGSGVAGVLQDPVLVAIASEVGQPVGAVVLQWHVQRGITPIPKSTKPHRIVSNITPPGFELSEGQMERIACLGSKHVRVCPDPADIL